MKEFYQKRGKWWSRTNVVSKLTTWLRTSWLNTDPRDILVACGVESYIPKNRKYLNRKSQRLTWECTLFYNESCRSSHVQNFPYRLGVVGVSVVILTFVMPTYHVEGLSTPLSGPYWSFVITNVRRVPRLNGSFSPSWRVFLYSDREGRSNFGG